MIRGFHHYDPSDVYSSRIYSNRLLYFGHILWFLSYLKGLLSRQRFISRVRLTCSTFLSNFNRRTYQMTKPFPKKYIDLEEQSKFDKKRGSRENS